MKEKYRFPILLVILSINFIFISNSPIILQVDAAETIFPHQLVTTELNSSVPSLDFEISLDAGDYVILSTGYLDSACDMSIELYTTGMVLLVTEDTQGTGLFEKLEFTVASTTSRIIRILVNSQDGYIWFAVSEPDDIYPHSGYNGDFTSQFRDKAYSCFTMDAFEKHLVVDSDIGMETSIILNYANGEQINQFGGEDDYSISLGSVTKAYDFILHNPASESLGDYHLSLASMTPNNVSLDFNPFASSSHFFDAFSFMHDVDKGSTYYYEVSNSASQFNLSILRYASSNPSEHNKGSLEAILETPMEDGIARGFFTADKSLYHIIQLVNLDGANSDFHYEFIEVNSVSENDVVERVLTGLEPSLSDDFLTSNSWMDLYEITVPNDRIANIYTTSYDIALDVDLTLLDDKFTLLSESITSFANETIQQSLSPGTYYIQIDHEAGLGTYDLTWNLTRIPEDDVDKPDIESSNDLTLNVDNTNFYLNWTIYDEFPSTYSLYKNNEALISNLQYIDGEFIQESLADLSSGVYNFTLVATDLNSNSNMSTIFVTINDNYVPIITPLSTSQAELGANVTLEWTVDEHEPYIFDVYDNGTQIIEGQSLVGDAIIFSSSSLSVGYHNITLIAYDISLNRASTTVFLTIVDTIAPSFQLVELEINDYIIPLTNISILIIERGELVSVFYNWDSGTNQTLNLLSPEILAPENEGVHVLNIYAQDESGNKNSEIFLFTVDSTNPTITFKNFNKRVEQGTTFGVDLEVSDNYGIRSVTVYVDGVLITTLNKTPYSVMIDTTGMSLGEHTVTAYVFDYAGNEASISDTFALLEASEVNRNFWKIMVSILSVVGGGSIGTDIILYKKLRYRKPYKYIKKNNIRLQSEIEDVLESYGKKFKDEEADFLIYLQGRDYTVTHDKPTKMEKKHN